MARKPAALRKKEDIEAVPIDQPVDIDLRDDPIVTIERDDDQQDPPRQEARQEPSRHPDNDEIADLKKQLAAMQQAENASKQAAEQYQRDLLAERKRIEELQAQNQQGAVVQLEAELDSVLNAIAAAEAESQRAEADLLRAGEMGDHKLVVDAQRRLARSEARLESLEPGKSQLEARIDQARKAPPPEKTQQQQYSDPLEAHIAQLPDLAKSWVRKHREYMENEDKNVELQLAHLKARKEGIQLYSQKYIDFIEQELGLRQSDDGSDPEPARSRTVSAPVSRETPSPSSGRPQTSRITLTAEEREAARASMPGIPPGEAEKIYAQQKLKLNGLKAAGHYNER